LVRSPWRSPRRLTCPSVPVLRSSFSSQAHLTASARFRVRAPGPISGRLSRTTTWRGRPSCPGFPLSFDYRHSLLGHQIPAEGLGLPHGRLTGQPAPDLDGGYRVSHARAAIGVGASCAPRTAVLFPAGRASQPTPAASQRPVLMLRYRIPSAELTVTRHRSEVQVLHPSDLPLACGPRMERAPLGFCLMLRTPPGTPATHVRPRPGHEHGPGTTPSIFFEPPINAFTHMRATSRRKPVRSSPRPRPPGWNEPPLELPPELRTPPTKSRTTHVEVGTGHRARTWNYQLNITSGLILQSGSSLNTCDLASHVRRQQFGRCRGGCCSCACYSGVRG
jgi:hypothetical protein